MTLWRYHPITGYWGFERNDILPENRAAYLAAYERQEPKAMFVFSLRKPRAIPQCKQGKSP